jgi:hypothetical protein
MDPTGTGRIRGSRNWGRSPQRALKRGEASRKTTPNETVTTTRRPDAEVRTRRHLTPDGVKVLVEAAKANRHGLRDATMILVAFRHGLRAAEVCDLPGTRSLRIAPSARSPRREGGYREAPAWTLRLARSGRPSRSPGRSRRPRPRGPGRN